MAAIKALLERGGRAVQQMRRLAGHAETPVGVKVMLGLALAYVVSPVQLVPNVIPILGQLDDVAVVAGALWLARRVVPPAVYAACRGVA